MISVALTSGADRLLYAGDDYDTRHPIWLRYTLKKGVWVSADVAATSRQPKCYVTELEANFVRRAILSDRPALASKMILVNTTSGEVVD